MRDRNRSLGGADGANAAILPVFVFEYGAVTPEECAAGIETAT